MTKPLTLSLAFLAAATLAACGGSSEPAPIQVAATDATVAAAPAVTAAVANVPFTFPSGVTQFATTAPTTISFTDTAATPAFAISSGGNTATGTTTFGSCVFAVTSSTFPAGHPLAVGKTVTVNPCNMAVGTAGAVANGIAQNRSIALVLGNASSNNVTITVGVTPGGQLTLNGNAVGQVTLTPVTG